MPYPHVGKESDGSDYNVSVKIKPDYCVAFLEGGIQLLKL